MDEKKLLSVDEIEEIYGISRQILIKAIKDKKLKGSQIPGKAYRVEAQEIKRFINERNNKSNVK